ncbi:hypothetical protein [Falsiroseomonas sp. HW251]
MTASDPAARLRAEVGAMKLDWLVAERFAWIEAGDSVAETGAKGGCF